jgi:hypothetical protein
MPWRGAPKGIVFGGLLITPALSLYTVNVNTRADTALCPLSASMGLTDHAKNQLIKLVLVVWCSCEKWKGRAAAPGDRGGQPIGTPDAGAARAATGEVEFSSGLITKVSPIIGDDGTPPMSRRRLTILTRADAFSVIPQIRYRA